MEPTGAFVVEARIALAGGVDERAVGAAVTTALCGHWEHEPPCRWPHNNAIRPDGDGWLHRTLVVAPLGEEALVHTSIETALREAEDWTVLEVRARPVADGERRLAENLLAGPRRRV